ncbi:pyridoxamine 5'-phosphate oxidase family protein [Microbacterium xanthum]|uniref:pyridoxamine 5'-phosphate oxidase family protein n=1 Tax=Microbacterium xanthum TaxID=3079794 RepID=UPI002AD27CC2|nr:MULTISPECIES: pyridoxamine 5'-phosphate oxidase family protein [unclassified Microbacterium]MDZ8171259.1 pyridoxamine 5'-phosphate oxidase family protein [Microbacterium sp. KSW-48]MDZ8201752.1 pyridoxamine 5'-phosphate oxidase family protein [Microbacterium sp. SSW1-59]
MGKTFDGIDDTLAAWITDQHMFFVATAPLSAQGRVNLSPRGLDSLSILDERTVAWLDLTGSGAETIAHVRENGRITVMFCSFDARPRIVRLHGRGRIVLPGDDLFARVEAEHPGHVGARAVIVVDVERASDSCGWGVPQMDFVAERDIIRPWAQKKGADGLATYREANNTTSLDGLPAL